MRNNRKFCVVLVACVLIASVYLLLTESNRINIWLRQTPIASNNFEIYKECQLGELKAIRELPAFVKQQLTKSKICRQGARIFSDLFDIEELSGQIELPDAFRQRLEASIGKNLTESLQHDQPILKIFHKIFLDEAIYCILRGKRPASVPAVSEWDFTQKEIEDSRKHCDFCSNNYLNYTAYDETGRFESELSFTAANSFKYDKWHTLVFSREHNPLNLSREQFVDLFVLSKEWISAVNTLDQQARYPIFMWDTMSKSGASQIHPHIHVSLARKRYCAVGEKLLHAAEHYYNEKKRDIFLDSVAAHAMVNLAYRHGDAFMFLNLNAMKNYEFIVIGPTMNRDFLNLLHASYSAFVDTFNRYSFSLGCYDRPLNEYGRMPAYCRVVFREYLSSIRNDFNGLDLHMSAVISEDKFAQMPLLRPKIKEYLEL